MTPPQTVNVGVIGLGMMGLTHLDVYSRHPHARIVAISDKIPDRLSGKSRATGNIEGQAKTQLNFEQFTRYDEGMKLIADPNVQLVDICLTTPDHIPFAIAALSAGKHVLVEKPLARSVAEARPLVQAAATAKTFIMVAMCMRFWPGWTWLKQAVDQKTYGAVRAAQFRRVATLPNAEFYRDGTRSGGAILDLHIHDTDFICHLFGTPRAVSSVGYSSLTGATDHVVTQYRYDHVPLVVAEGGWAMSGDFPFQMQYTLNFERATAVFDLAAKNPLTLHRPGRAAEAINIPSGMGYEHEIAYFLNCILRSEAPKTVTVADAMSALAVIEAEILSINTGQPITL